MWFLWKRHFGPLSPYLHLPKVKILIGDRGWRELLHQRPIMKRELTLLIGGVICLACSAQNAQLVFNNAGVGVGQHPFVVFNPDNDPATNPGAYLVIDNSNANAITMAGAVMSDVPIIKSETELNKIRWAIGAGAGMYTVPFSTQSGVAIPLSVTIAPAGVGSSDGSIIFSTYNYDGKGTIAATDRWNNFLYKPTDVTHMNDFATGMVNNSENAIDRFWIIDASEGSYAYSTKPAVNITFVFDPADAAPNGGNTPGLALQLLAQRFNPLPPGFWGDMTPIGTLSVDTVSGVIPPTTADFYRSWTLASRISPLPIELLAWSGACDGSIVKLTWTTASEQDNAYFTIEKSKDATTWTALGEVHGAGNSSSQIQYAYIDPDASGLAYYRLRQTDIDGQSTVSPTIAAGCDADNGTRIVNAWDDGHSLNVVVASSLDGTYDLTLLDAQGKLLLERSAQAIGTGSTTLRLPTQSIASGIYVVRLQNASNSMARRVHLN